MVAQNRLLIALYTIMPVFFNKKHTFCVQEVFFLENLAFYETMWKNIIYPDRPQMTVRHMRIAC